MLFAISSPIFGYVYRDPHSHSGLASAMMLMCLVWCCAPAASRDIPALVSVVVVLDVINHLEDRLHHQKQHAAIACGEKDESCTLSIYERKGERERIRTERERERNFLLLFATRAIAAIFGGE